MKQTLTGTHVSGIGSPIHDRPEPEWQEFDMSEALDWNAKTIAEFRANEGRVGGVFEGAPIALVHHPAARADGSTSAR